jgi:tRNA(Ile)-lysidine synthetase-like protein
MIYHPRLLKNLFQGKKVLVEVRNDILIYFATVKLVVYWQD